MAEILRDVDHMSAVLPGAEDEIDSLRGRIVTAENFGGFRGEPEFAAGEIEAVRAAERAEVDGGKRLLCDEVHNRQSVQRAGTSSTVVGDVSGLAVGGGDDFVRIVADGNPGENFQ